MTFHRFLAPLLSALAALSLAAAPALAADNAWQIAVIPKGNTHEYWKSIHAGAEKARLELAQKGIVVTILWKGPLLENDREQQIQVVENFVAQRVSGIVLAPLDSTALVAPVEEAVASKIPVVIVDSDLKTKLRTSFVATDNEEGGRIAARNLGRLLEGKGNAIMLRYDSGSASTEAREAGFLEVMQTDFPGIKLISTDQHSGATQETAKTVSENLLNRFGAQANGIFACNESSASGMLLALRDAGLAGKVKFVAFDSSALLDDGLMKGEIQGLVVQNPMKMGYLGVKTAVAALRGEKVEPRIDTGVAFLTKANFDDPAMADIVHPPFEKYGIK